MGDWLDENNNTNAPNEFLTFGGKAVGVVIQLCFNLSRW